MTVQDMLTEARAISDALRDNHVAPCVHAYSGAPSCIEREAEMLSRERKDHGDETEPYLDCMDADHLCASCSAFRYAKLLATKLEGIGRQMSKLR